MLCSHCNKPNPSDYSFCSHCGESLEQETSTVIRPPAAQQKSFAKGIAAGVAGIGFVTAVALVAFYAGRSTGDVSPSSNISVDRVSANEPVSPPQNATPNRAVSSMNTGANAMANTERSKIEPGRNQTAYNSVSNRNTVYILPYNSNSNLYRNAANAMRNASLPSITNRAVNMASPLIQMCLIRDANDKYPQAVCKNGHLSYSKVFTCAMNNGVQFVCPFAN